MTALPPARTRLPVCPDDCDYNWHLSNSSYAKPPRANLTGTDSVRAGGRIAPAGTCLQPQTRHLIRPTFLNLHSCKRYARQLSPRNPHVCAVRSAHPYIVYLLRDSPQTRAPPTKRHRLLKVT
ncbi:hypothetical protein BJV78DRAFT_144363 [Lactifluus subvellereus]|nr:hypothetical protein BJV78DRAFT_144363 [Lactifluus subvellereus]